jgi:tRNA_anti-like
MAWISCPFCRASISENSTTCAYCAERLPPRPPTSQKKRSPLKTLFLSLLVVVGTVGALIIVLAVALTLSAGGDSGTTPATTQTALDPQAATTVTVTANELTAAYESNEIAADATFKGERVNISGRVNNVGTDILGSPYVLLADESHIFGVQALFPRDKKDSLMYLSKGHNITVRCRVDGKFMNVIAKDCELTTSSN